MGKHKIQRTPTLATCYRPRPACKISQRQAEAEEARYRPEGRHASHRRRIRRFALPAVKSEASLSGASPPAALRCGRWPRAHSPLARQPLVHLR